MRYEEIGDRIEVIAVFPVGGRLKPLKFKWKQRVYKIERVISSRKERTGQVDQQVYVVLGESGDVYEVGQFVDSNQWMLLRIGLDG
ncbi:hypothetical protein KQI63_15745 [bacterium]|nr:hypothetical protein [bacterium]